MTRPPNPARIFGFAKSVILGLIIFSSTISTILSADPVHHFTLEKPDTILEKQEISLNIMANLADGSLAKKAKNKIVCTFTGTMFNKSQEITMKNGEAKLKISFDHPMFVIVTIADKTNPDLFISETITIKREAK